MPAVFKEAFRRLSSGPCLLLLIFSILAFSCQDELTLPDTPEAETFQAESQVAELMMRIAMKDGSADDMVDGSSALSLEFPYAIMVNEEKVVITSEADYNKIELAIAEKAGEDYSLQIIFPVTVRLPDYHTITLSDYFQLSVLSNQYGEGPDSNPGISCVDIQYPVNFSYFNPVTEDVETYSIMNDRQLFEFLDTLENDYRVDLDFPVTVILSDGTQIVLEDLLQLEGTLNEFRDSCQDGGVPEEVVEEETEDKVAICHKTGNDGFITIYVSPNAVEAHLGHGDILGTCKDEKEEGDDQEEEEEDDEEDDDGEEEDDGDDEDDDEEDDGEEEDDEDDDDGDDDDDDEKEDDEDDDDDDKKTGN